MGDDLFIWWEMCELCCLREVKSNTMGRGGVDDGWRW